MDENTMTDNTTISDKKNTIEPIKTILEKEGKEIELLKNKNLLIEILKEVQIDGVVGEQNTLLALINKICLRLVKNAEPTSSNIIVSDETGAGKDYIVKKICKILLTEDKYLHRTDLSPTVLNYWNANKENFSWDGHVIHLEDPKEDTITNQAFKTMASGGNESTITIDNKAVDLKIKGKPVIIVTSLKATIDLEGGRRWDNTRVDTSAKQTEIIKNKKLERESGLIEYKPNIMLRHALQNLLQPKEVIIPFAKEFKDFLPNTIIIRTQINKLLDYIKSSAVLHQYNREKDAQGRIIANWFDYDYGRFVFLHLKDEEGIALNKDEEEFIKILREAKEPLSIKETATRYNRHGTSWIYDHLDDFKSKNLIGELNDWDDRANKEIKRIYATDEYVVNAISTSTWFYCSSTGTQENQQQEGFPVLLHFCEIYEDINNLRDKEGLSPLFIQLEENQENQIKYNDLLGENSFNLSDNKTEENQKNQTFEGNLSLIKQKIYENKKAGYRINLDFLYYNFGKDVVNRCIESGILVKKENGEYEFKGVI